MLGNALNLKISPIDQAERQKQEKWKLCVEQKYGQNQLDLLPSL